MAPLGAGMAALATAVLLGLAAVGLLRHVRGFPLRAAVLCGCWMLVVSLLYWHSLANTPGEAGRYRVEAERVAGVIGDAPLRYVGDSLAQHPDLEFLFFLRRIVPLVKPGDLGGYRGQHAGPVFAMADRGERWDAVLRAARFEFVFDFEDESNHRRTLWVRDESIGWIEGQ